MNSALEQPKLESNQQNLCCYVNLTPQIQVVRISNIQNWYLERVVFPLENLLFEAPPASELEVYQGGDRVSDLVEKIPCDRLLVDA